MVMRAMLVTVASGIKNNARIINSDHKQFAHTGRNLNKNFCLLAIWGN